MTREETREYNQAYRAKRLLTLQAQARTYAKSHRPEKKAYDEEYRLENKDTLKEKKRQYYLKNRERILAKEQQTRAQVPGARIKLDPAIKAARQTARIKTYARTHPEIIREIRRRHRARKLNAPVNDLTVTQWKEIKEAFGFRCAYCDRKMRRLEQEHIIPLSKGGAHSVSNIVPACRSCNAKKHAGPPLRPVQPLLLTLAPAKNTIPPQEIYESCVQQSA